MAEYISSTETAKLIRLALKKAFPKVKFSVRKDGGSINITWVDGPTDQMVGEITSAFAGEGFDGMIDMRYSLTSYLLEDGTVVPGKCGGTVGSGGTVEAYSNVLPNGAREICFMTDFIFTTRKISNEFLATALSEYKEKWGEEAASRVRVYPDDGYGAGFNCDDYYEERNLREIVRNQVA